MTGDSREYPPVDSRGHTAPGTGTPDLVTFLRARLDEDYETAWGAEPSPWAVGKWRSEPYEAEILGRGRDVTAVSYYGGTTGHIHRFDPTRMLREVQAKRAILDLHSPLDEAGWITCKECFDPHGTQCPEYPCETVRHLASVYTDHPDYDESWRP